MIETIKVVKNKDKTRHLFQLIDLQNEGWKLKYPYSIIEPISISSPKLYITTLYQELDICTSCGDLVIQYPHCTCFDLESFCL